MLEQDDDDAAHVANQRQRGDAFEVPREGNLLKSHGHDAGCRADDEDAAAHAGAVGQQVPEDAVLEERLHVGGVDARGNRCGVGNRVHAHAGRHERHVVDDRREQADDARDGEDLVDVLVEELGHLGQDAGALQRGYRHQDAEEEEDGRHVDVLEHLRYAVLDGLLDAALLVVDDFGEHPHHAQRNHHPHVGGQMGDALEDRHEEQAEDADHEDELAQTGPHALGQAVFGGCGLHHRGFLAGDVVPGDGRRNGRRDECRQEERAHERLRGDVAAHPEHDGRHVADGRPCAAAVGRDDDDAGEEPALLAVGDDAPQQHHHDDGGGHVVEHRRHEEGDDGQQPEQLVLVVGGDVVGDDAEASVGVDEVDDGHGTDEVNQNFARVAQMVNQLVGDVRVVAEEAEDGPDGSAHEQCDGRLVHLDFVLQRDEGVAYHEEQNHGWNHFVWSFYLRYTWPAFGVRPASSLRSVGAEGEGACRTAGRGRSVRTTAGALHRSVGPLSCARPLNHDVPQGEDIVVGRAQQQGLRVVVAVACGEAVQVAQGCGRTMRRRRLGDGQPRVVAVVRIFG